MMSIKTTLDIKSRWMRKNFKILVMVKGEINNEAECVHLCVIETKEEVEIRNRIFNSKIIINLIKIIIKK